MFDQGHLYGHACRWLPAMSAIVKTPSACTVFKNQADLLQKGSTEECGKVMLKLKN